MSQPPKTKNFAYENPLKIRFGRAFFNEIPEDPGVYFMLDSSDQLLYIGKAKNLRRRLMTYSQAKPGQAEERTLELVEFIKKIRWEIHRSEHLAHKREGELIRTLRPIYNIAGNDDEIFLYFGLKKIRSSPLASSYEMRLSNWTYLSKEGFQLFGAFQHRSKIKLGYTALLRILNIYQHGGPRFHYPAKISRIHPPWIYHTQIPKELELPFLHFFKGINQNLIRIILVSLLENDSIPEFMRPSIQDDINAIQMLFKHGPSYTRRLKRQFNCTTDWISPEEMRKMKISTVNIPGLLIGAPHPTQ